MSTWWLSQPAPEPPIPTVVVEPQLNLPPEVLDRLAPAPPTGLTQPMATLIGSGFTLLAAVLALGGVLFVQYMTRKNLTAQLDKQQELHEDAQERQAAQHEKSLEAQLDLLRMQVHAETQKQERTDRLNALFEAQSALISAKEACLAVATAVVFDRETTEGKQLFDRFDSSITLCEVPLRKLELLGMDQSHKALQEAVRTYEDCIFADEKIESVPHVRVKAAYDAATSAFKLDMKMTP
ncbi:hypothetical protein [Rhodococcus opacus]|uniref:hypothetical protein n=1 Tax=Rhodococcus opacus TaxID=37919 RepID=UPI00223670C4|nr:hypothetical protein [Rhodococcus opacus]UZG58240.1 hypothetical protein ONE62_13375 [Rhodococcus opacus]